MNCGELKEILENNFSKSINTVFEYAFRELQFYEASRLETSHLFLAILRQFPGIVPFTMQEFRETLGPGNSDNTEPVDQIEVSKTIESIIKNSHLMAQSLKFRLCINPILLYNFFKLDIGYHIQYLQEKKVNINIICEQQHRLIYSQLIQSSPTIEEKFNGLLKYIDIEFANINIKLNQLLSQNRREE